jgi:hypothetical protein
MPEVLSRVRGLRRGVTEVIAASGQSSIALRLSDADLTRMRAAVDSGRGLDRGELELLRSELRRASATIEPAAETLRSAIDEATREAGHRLGFVEIELLWAASPGLEAVKDLYDRERALWRRANNILHEGEALTRGETFEFERRAPHPVGPGVAPEFERRAPR